MATEFLASENHFFLPFQGRTQNLKEVPQNYTDVFNIYDVTTNGTIEKNQQRKEKK